MALLRAIRLRQAAPDAVAAGIADTVEALREQAEAGNAGLPPGEHQQALPPGSRPGLPPHHDDQTPTGQPLRPRWASPAANRPDPSRPEAGQPPADLPGAREPGAGVPGVGRPGAGVPGAELPGAGVSGPGSGVSGAGGSGAEWLGADRPGEGRRDADGPGGQTPDVTSAETPSEGSAGRSFWDRRSVRAVPPALKREHPSDGPGPAFPGGATPGLGGAAPGAAGATRRPWTPAIDPTRSSVRKPSSWGAAEEVELPTPAGGRGGAATDAPGAGDEPGRFLSAAEAARHSEAAGAHDGPGEAFITAEEALRYAETLAAERASGRALRTSEEAQRYAEARGAEGRALMTPEEALRYAEARGAESQALMTPEEALRYAEARGNESKALMTPDEAGRYADVEAVGKASRNQFAGLPGRRAENVVRPVAEPWVIEGPELEAGPRPEWAAGRVRDEGGFLRGEAQREGSTRPAGAPAPRLPGFDLPHVMPPMVSRSRSAGDGMDPADDALLRQTQRLLSTSLTFAGGPVEVAERLRVALLQAHPSLMAALPGGAATQTAQLTRALTWLVHHLDRPPLLVEGTGRLGAALAACGVDPSKMHLVGAALAEAMRAGMAPGQWRQDFDLAWRSTWQHVYEWITHGAARAAYDPPVWDATVVEHQLRRPDLAVVRLRPELPMPFRPGQFTRVQVPELPAVWRPYSLAGAPRRDDVVELHVRAKTTTGVSGTLVHRTAVGDRVRLSRAEGAMTLPEQSGRDLLMIAGDTGVAPLKALLTELADTGDTRSAVLFWGVRDLDELYDIDEIAEVARAARRATVVPVVSEGDPGPYASGLVTDAVAAYGEWSDHEVYLAGPPLMLAATSLALQQLGVTPDRIHHDAPE